MSCSCTGNCDLISIEPIVLSDTFHTWYDRTNEIIDILNNVNVYEVQVGLTNGGLTSISGCENGNYNGVLTVKVNPGPGIGVGTTLTPSYYLNHTMIDVSGMTAHGSTGYDAGLVTAFPAIDDWFIFSDASDGSLGSGNGTPKKIKAQQILPPTVYLPTNFEFVGNVEINGNLTVAGTQSTVDSNEVLIEDKAIELAYRRFVAVDVTGPTSNTFPAAGMTFRYYDAANSVTGSPTTIGQISSVVFNGTRTALELHNFSLGGVSDIDAGGRLSITGTIFDFTMIAGPTTTSSFFNDDSLDEAGMIVKGASGDKSFLWVYKEGPSQVLYNAFVSGQNLGVSGPNNAIISSKFRSYGTDTSADNTFQFLGFETGKPKIVLGGSTGSSVYVQYGSWSVQHDNLGGTGTQQPLVWNFRQYATAAESERFKIWSGASGQTYGSTTVNGRSNQTTNFAQGLNSDFLDGAHGTTNPTSYSIPVALTGGYIADGWVSPTALKAITKCFTASGHGFVVGDVVRLNPDTGGMTYALATSKEYAEVLGIVSSVAGNEFCVVSKGYINSLTGSASTNIYDVLPLVTGNVYFLSPNDPGGMIADPDNGVYPIGLGEVRKPLLLAMGVDSGYVLNYLGTVEGDETDIVEVQGIAPIGMVMPFTGLTTNIPYGWELCDGSRLEKGLWVELYSVIGQRYSVGGTVDPLYTGGVTVNITMTEDSAFGILADDLLTIKITLNGIEYEDTTKVVSVSGATITVEEFSLGSSPISGREVRVYGRIGSGGTSVFFLPDFRDRTLVGAGSAFDLGEAGGRTGSTLQNSNLPPHDHGLREFYVNTVNADAVIGVGFDSSNETATDSYYTSAGPTDVTPPPTAVSTMPPYTAIHWIIRAKKGLSALILSGHNHDDVYHPLNGNMTITAGAYEGMWSVNHPTDSLPYRTNGSTEVFKAKWSDNYTTTNSESSCQSYFYGDVFFYGDGITNDVDLMNSDLSFSVESLLNRTTVGGDSTTQPTLRFLDTNDAFSYIGIINGLTSPTEDHQGVNKFYSDTSNKYIYVTEDSPLTETVPTGFCVVADSGVVSSGQKSILSVFADANPTVNRAKTEVQVRGDLTVYGNGLTGVGNLTGHTHPTFSVDTLKGRITVQGGATYPSEATEHRTYYPTISLQNLYNPSSPVGDAIGTIEGLTAPSQYYQAANKWYVDSQISAVAPRLASETLTGVAMFDAEDFDVNTEGKVTLNRALHEIVLDTTDSDFVLPYNTGVDGFNIRTETGLLTPSITNYVFSVFANPSPGADDSNHEVFVAGDFTVFGDNFRNGSHGEVSFAVDPRLNKATIFGGHTPVGGGARVAPTLAFMDERGDDMGSISGLTAPSSYGQAANKWYVDAVYKIEDESVLSGEETGTLLVGGVKTYSGIKNGIWHVSVQGMTVPDLSDVTTLIMTVNGKAISSQPYNGSNHNAPITFVTIVEVTDGTLTISVTDYWMPERVTAYRIGGFVAESQGNS